MKESLLQPRRHLMPALLCCLTLAGSATLPAQGTTGTARSERAARPVQTVTGRVLDEKGQAVPGATVLVKGTTTGVSTDPDGAFSLDVPDGAVLQISYIGYVTQEVAVGAQTSVVVNLVLDERRLNEVVVVGYLTQNRQDVTGAVSSVGATELRRSPVATVSEAIQGRVPGVQITNSGAPGQAPNVNIRGLGTLGSGSGPLYVIDGLWTTNFRDFNPQDAESIQILKDAAALAPYGASGANGVIIITTRRGKMGAPVINFNAYTGIQDIPKRYDLAGAEQWRAINRQAYENSGQGPQPDVANPTGVNTDWQKELFQRGHIQDYNLSFAGGGEQSNYLLSGGYFRQTGTIIGPEFERYSARINSGFSRGRIRIGESLLLTRTNQTRVNNLPFIDVLRMTPITPVYDPANPGGFGFGNANNSGFGTNPIASQKLFENTGTSNRIQGSVFAEVSIFDFLRYRLNLATEYHGFHDKEKRQYGQWRQNDPLNPSSYAENQGNELFGMAENTLTFDKSFDKHNVTAVVGYTQQRFEQEFTRGASFGLGTGPTYYWALDAGTQNPQAVGSSYVWGKRSYLGQITYDYDQRYLLTAAFRRDGSSRFDPNNRWGNFGAASAGWRISKEAFFGGVTAISDLKLRASYGKLGNDQINGAYGGSYRYQGVINTNVNYPLGNDVLTNGAVQTQLASLGIGWEDRNTANYGVDMGFLENRLTLSADYYVSRTLNALVAPAIPLTFGNAGDNPFQRIGEIKNSGFEFVLGYNDNRKAFQYGATANLTTLKNEVIDLGESGGRNEAGEPAQIPNFFEAGPSGITRTEVGHEVGSFYLYEFDGIFQNAGEIANSAQPNAQPGDVRYKDLNGDGIISDRDRRHVGRVFPKIQYGLNLTASYGGFDIAAFFQGVSGNDVFNNAKYWLERTDDNGAYRADFNPWTPTNPSTTTPRAIKSGGTGANAASAGENARYNSTRWLEDGSYLRLKNLQIGYSVPKATLSRVKGINTFRVYLTGQNLFTITDYSGYDPETVGSGAVGSNANTLTRGVDEGSYPNLRTYTVGIQLGF